MPPYGQRLADGFSIMGSGDQVQDFTPTCLKPLRESEVLGRMAEEDDANELILLAEYG